MRTMGKRLRERNKRRALLQDVSQTPRRKGRTMKRKHYCAIHDRFYRKVCLPCKRRARKALVEIEAAKRPPKPRKPKPKKKPNGAVIYDGPSTLTGDRVIVIAVGLRAKSTNEKTGGMIQTYILRADRNPLDAIDDGADDAICGDCMHRGLQTGKRSCYVQVFNAPLAIWRAWKRGIYPDRTRDADIAIVGADRIVRVGAYGDPAAVPFRVWDRLLSRAKRWTGYTHQWRRPDAAPLRDIVMASCDSDNEADRAHSAGWRTFRVRFPDDSAPTLPEVSCPASAEMGHRVTCDACTLCSGTWNQAKSVVINVHGAKGKINAFAGNRLAMAR